MKGEWEGEEVGPPERGFVKSASSAGLTGTEI